MPETKVKIDIDAKKKTVAFRVQRPRDIVPIDFALSFKTVKKMAGGVLLAENDDDAAAPENGRRSIIEL